MKPLPLLRQGWALVGVVAAARMMPMFPSIVIVVPNGFDKACSFVRIRLAASGGASRGMPRREMGPSAPPTIG
jgi:hypothetical protein